MQYPPPEYFDQLMRVSSRQIIWGGNYFPLRPSRGWAIWDKAETMYGRDFSEAELAWMSMDTVVRVFKMGPNQLNRIHPTQKPTELYSWLLQLYAKPGQRILDTHLGSGSHAIACHYFGAHLTACEIDADYYAAACERIKRETAQEMLPMAAPEPEHVTADMFGAAEIRNK
jgi:site-specific DNA-methyltransferase (adenine-specific)